MAGPGDSYAKETRAYNPQFADENPEEEYDAKLEEVRGVFLPLQSRGLFISWPRISWLLPTVALEVRIEGYIREEIVGSTISSINDILPSDLFPG